MSANISTPGTISINQIQPKFKDCLLTSKTKAHLRTWIELIGGIVRNIENGHALEDFLDFYLERNTKECNTAPNFLQDDALQIGNDQDANVTPNRTSSSPTSDTDAEVIINNNRRPPDYEDDDDDLPSVIPNIDTTEQQREQQLPQRPSYTRYRDLPPEATYLDKILFNMLQTIVKGDYHDVISNLKGNNARYTFAIIALWKHAALEDSSRRLTAMDTMENLQFQGDGSKWKLDFLRAVREVYESKLTLEHWIMHCAFKSYEGKSSQVQAMIVQDINNDDLITPSMNFDQVANNYSSFISTLQAGKGTSINYVDKHVNNSSAQRQDKNQHDGRKTFKTPNNRKTYHKNYKSEFKAGVYCGYCKREGHTEDECRTKKQEEYHRNKGRQKHGEHEEADINNVNYELTPTQVTGLCDQLKNGRLALHIEGGNTSVSSPPLPHDSRIDHNTTGHIAFDHMHENEPHGNFIEASLMPPTNFIGTSLMPPGNIVIKEKKLRSNKYKSRSTSHGLQTSRTHSTPHQQHHGYAGTSTRSSADGNLSGSTRSTMQIPTESQAWNPEARNCTTTSTPLEAYDYAGYPLRPGLGDHCEPSPNREYLGKHEVNTSRIPMEPTTSLNTLHQNLLSTFDKDEPESNKCNRMDSKDQRGILHPNIDPNTTSLNGTVSRNNTLNSQNTNVYMALPSEPQENTILSLCDGMGCLALSLKEALPNYVIHKYLAVEKDPMKRRIADAANPRTKSFPGIEHGLNHNHDIFNITEEDIKAIPPDQLKLIGAGPECNDFSKLRLLPDRPDYNGPRNRKGKDPRKGLNGKYGKTFRAVIKIIGWAMKHHPNVKYFVENVEFSDMPRDWAEVCDALGRPTIINAHDYSYTRRKRAYWTNIAIDPMALQGGEHKDPNSAMDPGRRIQKHHSSKGYYSRPIGASWHGKPDSPVANTNAPVLVFDENHDEPQHLRVNEAERLMGMTTDTTKGAGISNLDRMKSIGGGWDINVTSRLLRYFGQDTRDLFLAAETYIDKLSSDITKEQLHQCSTVYAIRETSPDDFNNLITESTKKYGTDYGVKLIAMAEYYSRSINSALPGDNFVMDSGAGCHVDPDTIVTDPDNKTRLTGFLGEATWTKGRGHIPLRIHDDLTGHTVDIDINNADNVTKSRVSLLSMGKLINDGWHFDLSQGSAYAYTPTGIRVTLDLGRDNVLRMPRDLRTGQDADPLPINTVRPSTKEQVTSEFLHKLFNHANPDKIHRTLGVTQGYKQPEAPLPGCYCQACAKANSRRKGLSRKVNICTEARTTSSSHVDTTRQGPHTTVNGVNTVNMVNGTVNIGDFNAKNARSTHQDADESTLGLRG